MTTALARVYASSGRTTDGVMRRSAPSPMRAALAPRPASEIPRTLRGIVIPVRMSPSASAIARAVAEVVRAHERPAREAVSPHGSDDVPLAARQLEIEVNAGIRRLFDEEAQRVVERRRLGQPSLRASARRRARRWDEPRTSNSTRSTPDLHRSPKRAQRVLRGQRRRAPVPDAQRPPFASLDGDHGVGLVGR